MDDIRRQDIRIFLKEALAPSRIILTLVIGVLAVLFVAHSFDSPFRTSAFKELYELLAFALVVGISGGQAWFESEKNRWLGSRTKALWAACQDRLNRYEQVLKSMRRDQLADFREMPRTIRRVYDSLYLALRRADIIAHEVTSSERGLYETPPVFQSPSRDPQSNELYRLADKNIAEYRAQYAGVMAGVQRTEAQSAVFITTLDTLRMKMIGYRLVGRSPELSSHDFLEALAEARTQLQAIDTALEELDLGHYPKTIAVVPPPPPEDAFHQHNSV